MLQRTKGAYLTKLYTFLTKTIEILHFSLYNKFSYIKKLITFQLIGNWYGVLKVVPFERRKKLDVSASGFLFI